MKYLYSSFLNLQRKSLSIAYNTLNLSKMSNCKGILILVLFTSLLFTGCSLKKGNAGIDIKSTPQSKVFLNDKEMGTTPYVNKQIEAGEYIVKLVSENGQWTSNKVRIVENTLFTINRELAENPDDQTGENVSLEKGKGIAVFTTPSQADISLDGQFQDKSPYLIAAASKGVHEITLTKEGYVTRTIKVKNIDGYKVFIEAQLKKASGSTTVTTPEPTATPSATVSPSPSASVKATATPKPTLTPKPSASAQASASPASSTAPGEKTITINSPETGWLRVRNKPGADGAEIARVNDGETYSYEEQLSSGWTAIVLKDGTKGYVSSKYVKVNK
jgi:hypothetical protein